MPDVVTGERVNLGQRAFNCEVRFHFIDEAICWNPYIRTISATSCTCIYRWLPVAFAVVSVDIVTMSPMMEREPVDNPVMLCHIPPAFNDSVVFNFAV